jgi:hypothetical protein
MSALSADQIASFIRDGFVRIDNAFSKQTAEQARSILWQATGCDPSDRSTWTRPVIRLGHFTQTPFREAANTGCLQKAFDQLVGAGRWLPVGAVGTCPIRFPSADLPGDDGWHVDTSFGLESSDFMEWRANVMSRGRALLMLFLFSDVEHDDAPTRLRVGSHLDVARQLTPAGEAGRSLRELAADGFSSSAHRPVVSAVGEAGTVYLCHPFIVHAAQPHRGKNARFLAQPPLLPREPLCLDRASDEYSPVERAILRAIRLDA